MQTATQPFGAASYQYDLLDRRTRLTWNDGYYVNYGYDDAGDLTTITGSDGRVLATYGYDALGRRSALTRAGSAVVTSYGYDRANRLTSLTNDLRLTANDVTFGYGYDASGAIRTRTMSNNTYAWDGSFNLNRAYQADGLDRYTQAGSAMPAYDLQGNLRSSTSGGVTTSYSYTSENLLSVADDGAPGGTDRYTLGYDPANRLAEYDTTVSRRFLYDGDEVIAEIENPTGNVVRRYVRGPGDDEPIAWYEGAGTTDLRWLAADERGSVIAVTDVNGNATSVNSYDEYGIPGSGNAGTFQYTGQMWLPELGLYHYKARTYSATLGRFLQTDPIGFAGGQVNLYNYVGNDPVNDSDPSGLVSPGHDKPIKVPDTPPAPDPGPGPDIDVFGSCSLSGLCRVLDIGDIQSVFAGHSSPPLGAFRPSRSKPQNNQPHPCRPTAAQLAGSGQVSYKFTEAGGAALFGYTHAEGSFTTANGYSGHFTSYSYVFGTPSLGGGAGTGTSRNLATFSGANVNITGNLGRISISDNFDPVSGAHVGETNGIATPGVGLGITRSYTTISNVTCPAG